MFLPMRLAPIAGSLALAGAVVGATSALPPNPEEVQFMLANRLAMNRMMTDMQVRPSGDEDRDFVAMMVPHHQGAIDMAQIELRYGDNEVLLRICQEIIAEQLQEMAAMRVAVDARVSPYQAILAASTAKPPARESPGPPFPMAPQKDSITSERVFLAENATAMKRMMTDMNVEPTGNIDRDFVAMMISHHQGAIDMAQAELRYGHSARLRPIVQEIVVDQMKEITMMRLAVGETLPPSVPSPTGLSPPELPGANRLPEISADPRRLR